MLLLLLAACCCVVSCLVICVCLLLRRRRRRRAARSRDPEMTSSRCDKAAPPLCTNGNVSVIRAGGVSTVRTDNNGHVM